MRFLHEIENTKAEKLDQLVSKKISKVKRKSIKNNPEVEAIGYQVDCTPQKQTLIYHGDDMDIQFSIRCFYNSFITENQKMVYGLSWDPKTGLAGNGGNYYYLDDEEYLYEFCRYIKDIEVLDEIEFFGYIRDFLKDYFGRIKQQERDQMYNLLYDHNNQVITPTSRHSIKDFRGKGSAMCSEYSSMAHNILRLFDFESYLVIGNEIVNDQKPESHAYNLVTYKEDETGETVHLLIDFTNGINVYDINMQKIGEEPFIAEIPSLDQDFVDRLVNGEEHMTFDEYGYYIMGNTMATLAYDNRTRDYYVDKVIRPDTSVKQNKIYALTK